MKLDYLFKHFKKHMQLYIGFAILLGGIFLRTYAYGYYPLGFDHVQILENAEKISAGDLIVLGPRTGPAELFTGPLIYYLAVPLLLLGASYYTVVLLPILLAFITGSLLWWLSSVEKKLSLVVLSLWAFSPLILPIDRMAWNPNLTLLASSLLFFPLLALNKKYSYRINSLYIPTELLLIIGAFLGYQAHFSGLFLAPIAFVYLLLIQHKNIRSYLSLMLGYVASLAPTLLFDIKHDFLNTRGVLNLVFAKTERSPLLLLKKALHSFQITVENTGGILLEGNTLYLILLLGILLLGFTIYSIFKNSTAQTSALKLSMYWSISIALLFALYSGDSPEYYYFIQLPALFYIVSSSLIKLLSTNQQRLFMLIFFSYSFFTLRSLLHPLNLEIQNQTTLMNHIDTLIAEGKVNSIVYDMPSYDSIGLEYLISQKNYQLNENGEKLHIIYPYKNGNLATFSSSNAALWLDSRDEANWNYVSKPDYLIETPKDVLLVESNQRIHTFGDEQFILTKNNQLSQSHLLVQHITDKNKHMFKELTGTIASAKNSSNGWKYVNEAEHRGFFYLQPNLILYYPVTETEVTAPPLTVY